MAITIIGNPTARLVASSTSRIATKPTTKSKVPKRPASQNEILEK